MSKPNDLEKGTTLPDLSDVYGGVEDTKPVVGGVSEEQHDAIASSSPKASGGSGGSSGSWFTKKRIIIIAVIAVIVVAGAVGGGVGGALGSKKSSNGDSNSPGSNSSGSGTGAGGDQTTSGPNPTPTTGTVTQGSGNNGSPVTIIPNAGATGIILPTGVTAVAFSGVPKPAATGTPLEINLGFPGLTPGFGISAGSLVENGEFKQNLTGWENTDGCWNVNAWDDKGYLSAWNGEHSSAKACELSQTMGRRDNQGKDTDYVVSFLYRNALANSSDNAWFWAYIGDEDRMMRVLATREGKPTSEDEWSKAAYKYTVGANKKAKIVFRAFNDIEYWEVSEVAVTPLDLLTT
ncbi:hypothetical protein TWF106_000235 [Orbilia oligospora]|uniref:Fucose-specific lectin n=1 Tax=Orbilia oligospora TaxID=2813651 RepID=A0A6G1M421_ORBOL|nr:hypothetical protein TWF788_010891 [Orbilia oligospora]KAF3217738.1 hypothetical protein TWF679_001939 [Orbilia oligospora]KAF3226493.1 hypothetical protein TWF106_000235 [Orbilia oligospora]KAF3232357.1 hypothetical protein TWF191_000128 [Orbilia oligospora]KAF3242983.1 hypothetical protein TWF192_008451 [Orbilia oligospora]